MPLRGTSMDESSAGGVRIARAGHRVCSTLRLFLKVGLLAILVTFLVIPVAAAPPRRLAGWHPLRGWWAIDQKDFAYMSHVFGVNGQNCSTIVLGDVHHLSLSSCVRELRPPLATASSKVTSTDYGWHSEYVLVKVNHRDATLPDSAPTLAEQAKSRAFGGEWRLSPNTRRLMLRWRGRRLELGQAQIVDNKHCPGLKRLDHKLVCAFSETAELDPDSNEPIWLIDMPYVMDGDVGRIDSRMANMALIIGACTQRTNTTLSCPHIGKDKEWIQAVVQGNQSFGFFTWLFNLV